MPCRRRASAQRRSATAHADAWRLGCCTAHVRGGQKCIRILLRNPNRNSRNPFRDSPGWDTWILLGIRNPESKFQIWIPILVSRTQMADLDSSWSSQRVLILLGIQNPESHVQIWIRDSRKIFGCAGFDSGSESGFGFLLWPRNTNSNVAFGFGYGTFIFWIHGIQNPGGRFGFWIPD